MGLRDLDELLSEDVALLRLLRSGDVDLALSEDEELEEEDLRWRLVRGDVEREEEIDDDAESDSDPDDEDDDALGQSR